MALTVNQARSVYDRIGRVQDWQAFYEDATINRLVANAALAGDQTIFEFGCGTGRLAANLLGTLPPSVNYVGVDISPVMINLATNRLAAWAERAKVVLVDGSLPLPADDGFADRVLSTFVFDLLDEAYARAVLDDLPADPRAQWPALLGQPRSRRAAARTGCLPSLDQPLARCTAGSGWVSSYRRERPAGTRLEGRAPLTRASFGTRDGCRHRSSGHTPTMTAWLPSPVP